MAFCVEQNINKTYICYACRKQYKWPTNVLLCLHLAILSCNFLPPLNPTKLLKQRGFYYIFAKAAELEGISICHRIYSSCFPCSEDFAKWDCKGLGCWHCSSIPIQTCFFGFLQTSRDTTFQWMMNASPSPKRFWANRLNGFSAFTGEQGLS